MLGPRGVTALLPIMTYSDLAVLHLIAKGQGASDPQALSLRCRDLVPDPLGGDFPFELGKGQKDVEGQPTHRDRGVELLGYRDE